MHIKSFIKSSGILIASNIMLKAINFFLMPIYTQYLTSEMLGISDTITSFSGLLFPILVMGLDSAFSAFYYDKEEEQAKKVFNTIFHVMLLLGMIPVILCLFSNNISYVVFREGDYSIIITLALISVSFNIWYTPFALNLRMKNKMLLYSAINIIASCSMLILNIIFVVGLELEATSLILSTLIVNALELLLFVLANKMKIQKKYLDWYLLKRMFRFAMPLIPMTILSWILSLSDRYILLYFYGSREVGLYGIGTRIMTVLNIFISSVSLAYTTFAYGSKSDINAKQKYVKVFDLMVVILSFTCFIIANFSKEIVEFMTTQEYYSAYVVVRDLIFAQLFYGITTIVSYGILFEKKSGYTLMANMSGAVINIALNVFFIPKYGIAAAAFTTLLGYVITFSLTYIFAQKLYFCQYKIKKAGMLLVSEYLILVLTSQEILIVRFALCFLGTVVILCLYKKILLEFCSLLFRKRLKKNE